MRSPSQLPKKVLNDLHDWATDETTQLIDIFKLSAAAEVAGRSIIIVIPFAKPEWAETALRYIKEQAA